MTELPPNPNPSDHSAGRSTTDYCIGLYNAMPYFITQTSQKNEKCKTLLT